ncbi:MAG: hypothetical protein LBJ22_03795 [Synergistaceae bacterium]|jgi:hypothetical protein|nr:hypothetical protein [Synergistaceae bacterium]
MNLTQKQETFCQAYIECGNASEAYRCFSPLVFSKYIGIVTLFVLLTLTALSLAPVPAYAVAGTISIGDNKMVDAGTNKSGTNWEWDADNATLTLSANPGGPIVFKTDESVKLVLTNDVIIEGPSHAIQSSPNLTIDTGAYTLTVKATNYGESAIVSHKDIYISGSTITVTVGGNGQGIVSHGDIDISDSKITATVGNNGVGIASDNNIDIRDSKITATVGADGVGIVSFGNIGISGGAVVTVAAGETAIRLRGNGQTVSVRGPGSKIEAGEGGTAIDATNATDITITVADGGAVVVVHNGTAINPPGTNVTGDGTGSVGIAYVLNVTGGTGSGSYIPETSVPITANPAPYGQVFDKWTGGESSEFGNANAASTTFTMCDRDATVTATYKSNGGGGGDPYVPPSGDDPYVPPSTSTVPAKISVTLSGAKIEAERQTDGTWLVILPTGTDVTALRLSFLLPAGATISPANNSAQDFSRAPVTYTVTAEDRTTTTKIVIAVKVDSPVPTERQYFSTTPGLCEVGYVTNQDGSVAVDLRIPLAANADPAEIEAIRAALTGVAPVGTLSYSYADTGGNLVPITTRTAKSASVPAPYLQITFEAASLDAVKAGSLEKITYWRKGDATEYTQTYTTPLAFSKMTLTDETPKPDDPGDLEPDDPGDSEPDEPGDTEPDNTPDAPITSEKSGGGCDAGIFALGLLPMAYGISKKAGKGGLPLI